MAWPDLRTGSGKTTDKNDNAVSVEVTVSDGDTPSIGSILEAAETALSAALFTAGYKDVASAMDHWYVTRAREASALRAEEF